MEVQVVRENIHGISQISCWTALPVSDVHNTECAPQAVFLLLLLQLLFMKLTLQVDRGVSEPPTVEAKMV